MGQGYALTEELMVENGVVQPRLPRLQAGHRAGDPRNGRRFIETMDGEGPQGAKGVGEAPAICIAAATANAIANATGVRIMELPFTPEKVYRALHGQTPRKPWKADAAYEATPCAGRPGLNAPPE
jgi:CO/xanthine dehydrogenase Mo-binding subunit